MSEDYQPDKAADSDRARTWAQTALADPRVVVLDTETTGLGPDAEVVEVAVIDTAGQVLYSHGFCPVNGITAGAAAVNRLRPGDLRNLPTFGVEYPALAEVLRDRIVISWNAEFDSRLLAQTCRLYGLPELPVLAWECAMTQHAAYRGHWSEYLGKYRPAQLREAWWVYGRKASPADHTALGDARACLAVLRGIANTPEEREPSC